MPYIHHADRVQLEMTRHAQNPGELNFMLTVEMLDYLDRKGLSYSTINEIVGAVTNALDEFKRRIRDPYEDNKIESNGDLSQFAYYKEHHFNADV